MSTHLDIVLIALSWPLGGLAVFAAFRPALFHHGPSATALIGLFASVLNGWMLLRGIISGPQVLLWAHAAFFGVGVTALGRGLWGSLVEPKTA